MKCPNCSNDLTSEEYKGIQVNNCSKCGGMWFDGKEVDQLEDTVFSQDDFKNSMITNVRESEKTCPKCEKKLRTFNYRWENLELEYCAKGDGFWVDKNEEKRITEIMEKFANDLERKDKVEESWKRHLKNLQSPSFIDRVRNIIQF